MLNWKTKLQLMKFETFNKINTNTTREKPSKWERPSTKVSNKFLFQYVVVSVF